MKQKRGISLITLVITIVVIVILTGAIVLSINNNNPIKQATDAVLRNDIANMREQQALLKVEELTKEDENIDYSTVVPDKYNDMFIVNSNGVFVINKKQLTAEQLNVINDMDVKSYGAENVTMVNGVPVPDGFYYIGGTKEDGFVISDKEDDDLNNTLQGNQFVWVPVEDFNKFRSVDWYNDNCFDESGEPTKFILNNQTNYMNSSGYWCAIGNPDIENPVQQIDKVYKSVKENKGFYVGRFEASEYNKTIKGVMPKVSISWGGNNKDIDSDFGAGNDTDVNGAAYKANNMISTAGAQSTAIYGAQWDAIMWWMKDIINKNVSNNTRFILDGTNMGNHYMNISPNPAKVTGSSESYKQKNIYDISGNVEELVYENYYSKNYTELRRCARGGSASNPPRLAAASRRENTAQYRAIVTGYRAALYLK